MTTTLIIPGLNSSGPDHWQSWFEAHIPGTVRVIQADWTKPDLPDWSARIRRDITRNPGRLFIVAHSFGVLAAVQAAHDHADRIAGALLVAPADPKTFGVDDVLPQLSLPFPSVVVGSANDPWMSLERSAHWADLWGSDFVNLGNAGHINAESGFGPWSEGLSLYARLRRAAEARHTAAHIELAQIQRSRSISRRPWSGSELRHRLAYDNRDVTHAASVLKRAGWSVTPPDHKDYVLSA
jgi:uncharacterized protein